MAEAQRLNLGFPSSLASSTIDDLNAQQQGQSVQELVKCGLRRHSWTAYINQAFHWSTVDLDTVKNDRENSRNNLDASPNTVTFDVATARFEQEVSPSSCSKMAYVRAIHEPPDGDWGWVVVACSALLTTLTVGLLICYGFLFSTLETALLGPQNSHLWIWLAAAAFALHNLTYPAWVFLSGRLSSRKVAALGSLLFSLIFLLSYLNKSHAWIYSVFIVAGFCTSACVAAGTRSVEEYFSSRLYTARSLSQSGWAIGLAFWPRVLDFSFSHGGTHWTLFVIGCICTLGILAASQFRPVTPYYKTFYVIQTNLLENLFLKDEETTRKPSRLWSCVFVIIMSITNVARTFVILVFPDYTMSVGFTPDKTATLLGVCGIAEVVGRLFGGWMLDHGFAPAIRCWICASFVLGVSTVICSLCSHYYALLACLISVGLAWGLWTMLSLRSVEAFLGKVQGDPSLGIAVCFCEALLSGAAPFATDVTFCVYWVKSSPLFIFGTVLILSFVAGSLTLFLFICRNRNLDVQTSLE